MGKIKIREQEEVLEISDGNAIVSASAGSGKTSVMVEKIIKYVFSGISVKNILALTFTKQAATELKVRLEKVLGEKIEKENRIELADEIDFLPQADISTFHSFYEKIVKKYFYAIGIQPNFEILTNEENLLLKEKAFLKTVENFKEEKLEGYNNLLDALGKKRSNKAIKERIFKLDSFCSSQFNPAKWLKEKAKVLYLNKEKTLSIFLEEVFSRVKISIFNFEKILSEIQGDNQEKLVNHVNCCISCLNEFLGKESKDAFSLIYSFKFPTLVRSNKELDCVKKINYEKEKFKEFLKEFKAFNFGNYEDVLRSFENCKEFVSLLVDFYLTYKEVLAEEKKEINKFDFSDLETMCYEILQNKEIGKEVKSTYKKIFVDEFQDINPMQFEILKLISSENVLFVGDAKQSIYAFRQSDVDIFVETCKKFEEEENSKFLLLKSNFRSNPKILNFANQIFNVLMTEKTSGINYEKTSQFEPKSLNSCEGNSVEILCVQKEETEEGEEILNFPSPVERERVFGEISQEAKIILGRISELVNEQILINGETRKVNFGDIAILLKSRSSLLYDLTKLFREAKVPFTVNDEVNLLEVKEIQQLISLLNLCFNFKNDFVLAPMLCSFFGKLSYDELSKIKLIKEGEFFFEKVESYCENNEIFEKIKSFKELIEALSFEVKIFGAKHALEKLINKTDFETYVLRLEQGEEKLEFVKQFLKYLESSGENNNLVKLVEYLNSLNEIKLPSLKKCNDNSVAITTIHASKGLEYPVVILADCGKDFLKGKPEKEDLKIDKEFGLAIKNYDKEKRVVFDSIFEKIFKTKVRKKEIAENLRLLYVALTRAKNKLIITGKLSQDVGNISSAEEILNLKTNYLEYILGAIKEKQIDSVFVDINGKHVFDAINQNFETLNFEKLKEQKQNLNFSYKNKDCTSLALKTSVSQILKESEAGEKFSDSINNFSIFEKQDFSSAEQGTLIHLILEKIDFNSQTLESDLKKLICENNFGVINEELLFERVLSNVKTINNILPKENKTFKEKEFMLFESPLNIFGKGTSKKLLIQGKVDLISIGEKNIIIDYKYTGIKSEQALINKYKNQLVAYSHALEKAISNRIDEVYILSLKQNKLIRIK